MDKRQKMKINTATINSSGGSGSNKKQAFYFTLSHSWIAIYITYNSNNNTKKIPVIFDK